MQILICISKRVSQNCSYVTKLLIWLVSFHYSTSQSTKYSYAATNSAFFLFNLGHSIWNTWKWLCRGDYMNISSFISGLNPHFIHPRSSGTCSLHLRGGRRRVCGCFSEVETQLYQLCPCVVRQEGWGHTPVPGETGTGRMHYLYGAMEW